MAVMTGLTIEATRHHGSRFLSPNPIGIVCHRTECPFDQARSGFVRGPKSVHFLLGKVPGNAVQLVDTNTVAYHVGPGANAFFIGIEFESIVARPGYEHKTDPLVNADPLTLYQLDMGHAVINWICTTHKIPKKGPPSRADMMRCRGKYGGLLNHASLDGFFSTDHGDALGMRDWAALLPYTGQLGDFPRGSVENHLAGFGNRPEMMSRFRKAGGVGTIS
jgi:N-acetylmuramoyl-L-alanine amidase